MPEVSDQIIVCACWSMCVNCIIHLFVSFALLYQGRVSKYWTAFWTFDFHDLTCGDHGVPLPWSFLGTSVSISAYMVFTLNIQSHLKGANACLVTFVK